MSSRLIRYHYRGSLAMSSRLIRYHYRGSIPMSSRLIRYHYRGSKAYSLPFRGRTPMSFDLFVTIINVEAV